MTNEQKFFGELTDLSRKAISCRFGVEKNIGELKFCKDMFCGDCLFHDYLSCHISFKEWLKQEYKEPVKLTEFERELLKRALKAEYKYIARDKSEKLFFYKGKPEKYCSAWDFNASFSISFAKDDFPFVKWEDDEPYNIEDLLKGEE